MLTEQMSDTQVYFLMTGVIALALGGLLLVIVWPLESEGL
jgi:hypothetical protein